MHAALAASRRNAAIVLAGLGLGVVIGGIGGRLAMYLLARLNPEATGVVSDDGFVMGQVTLSGTLNLLVVGGFLGAFGGVVYALARHLTFGPPWWRLTSVALGAGLPVAASIVHTDGVDFTLLEPVGLAVALFVAIPAAYGLALALLVERFAPPPPGWGRLEALRWLLRAGAAAVVAAAFLNLAGDVATLT
jgi:hypothetical protein